MKWRGYLATFEEVWADTEAEAIKKLGAKLSGALLSGDSEFLAWEVDDMPEPPSAAHDASSKEK